MVTCCIKFNGCNSLVTPWPAKTDAFKLPKSFKPFFDMAMRCQLFPLAIHNNLTEWRVEVFLHKTKRKYWQMTALTILCYAVMLRP